MIKADDKVKFEGADKPEKFTNFEECIARVDVLIDTINEHAAILQQNDLIKTTEEDAPYFEDDEVYNRIEE